MLDQYFSPNDDNYNHKIVLKDEKWIELVAKGVEAKKRLGKLLNEKEFSILNSPINYPKKALTVLLHLEF